MTRDEEIRNAIDTTFPIPPSEKGRTYEQALMATGFENGVKWADTHPKSPWINYKEEKPPFGVEVIAYHHKWVDEDFNPNGTRIGFLSDEGFTSAFWWDYQDCYETISKQHCESNKDFYASHIENTEPEFWLPMPKFSGLPKEQGKIALERMIKTSNGNWRFIGNVTHWFPIPELLKELYIML